VYTIKQAAELTGIPSATLRAWERRYPLPAPHRSPGGYRLYDDVALARMRLMHRLVRAGWAPRNAAAVALDGAGQLTELPSPDEFVEAVGAGLPPARREAILSAALQAGEPAPAIDNWLMPMLGALGDAWADARITVWQEHAVATAALRQLHVLFEAAPATSGPMVLTGLPSGSHHEVGVTAFNVLARLAGLELVYLGASLPEDDWLGAVQAHPPAAVVIAIPTQDDVPAARRCLSALAGLATPPLLLAGGARQDEVADLALPLGHSVSAAAESLAGLLTPTTLR
jgi:MerR family transcriptional regulator, light-induced transcriptional regulator